MGDAVIVSTARTAIGTARKGTLLDVTAFDLAKYAVGEALSRSGIAHDDVDDLQMGSRCKAAATSPATRRWSSASSTFRGSRSTVTARPEWPRCKVPRRASAPGWIGL